MFFDFHYIRAVELICFRGQCLLTFLSQVYTASSISFPSDLVRGVHPCEITERQSREMQETVMAVQEEKRETALIARPNEISVGLTTQNTIGWCVKR